MSEINCRMASSMLCAAQNAPIRLPCCKDLVPAFLWEQEFAQAAVVTILLHCANLYSKPKDYPRQQRNFYLFVDVFTIA